jgi:hypothetical protein
MRKAYLQRSLRFKSGRQKLAILQMRLMHRNASALPLAFRQETNFWTVISANPVFTTSKQIPSHFPVGEWTDVLTGIRGRNGILSVTNFGGATFPPRFFRIKQSLP